MGDIQQKMMNILFSDPKSMFFYWNCVENSWQVTGDYIPEMISDTENPLEILIKKELILPEDRNVFEIYMSQAEKGIKEGLKEDKLEIQCRLNSEEGFKWYRITSRFIKNELGQIQEMAGHLEPMTDIEIMQKQQIVHMTMDRNPQVFAQAVKKQFAKYPDDHFAFIQFDVEKFKMINELYGEDVGTEVLDNILNTLKSLCNEEQIYCRLSADIFMVVTKYQDEKQIVEFIHCLESHLDHYKDIRYRLAFGVYLVTDKTMQIRYMGDSAALARKSIKGNALQNVAFYKEDLKSTLYSRKFVEDNMEEALRTGQFVMYLQPKYSISDNEMIGAEALVRWIHPELGVIAPINFIPVLEDNGFIVKLDEYMWEQACITIRKWIDQGKKPVPISVNVSRVHLLKDQLITTLKNLLKQYQIPRELLELEITETVQNINIDKVIRSLKKEGYTLLMDDFGSGASSLNTLKNTPFDVIKIDREFLNDFIESDRGQKIIAHTIHMTKDIGLELIAEGVETKEQAMFLQDCGCDMAQGYYYAKPMPLSNFDELMK